MSELRDEMEPNLQVIGLRIREVRNCAGLTAKELAERIGITPQHMSDIERGRRAVTRSLAIEIAAHIDWYPDWIDLMMGRLPTPVVKNNYTPDDVDAIRRSLAAMARSEGSGMSKLRNTVYDAIREHTEYIDMADAAIAAFSEALLSDEVVEAVACSLWTQQLEVPEEPTWEELPDTWDSYKGQGRDYYRVLALRQLQAALAAMRMIGDGDHERHCWDHGAPRASRDARN